MEPAEPADSEPAGRYRAGGLGVAAVMVVAGLLFTTTAQTARGTQLRPQVADLASVIQTENARQAVRQAELSRLRQQYGQAADAAAVGDRTAGALKAQADGLEAAAGVSRVSGPGLVVTLDDAPRGGAVPAQASPDDLVVHQQDVQAVVNALWAGGATGMNLMDQRVISTSAVRCVGNTLILQGRVYSPPYRITAIGDVARLRAGLDASPEIQTYLQYVAALNLGWQVQERASVTLGRYDGPLSLSHSTVPTPTPTGGSG